jgi:hypothetical protein
MAAEAAEAAGAGKVLGDARSVVRRPHSLSPRTWMRAARLGHHSLQAELDDEIYGARSRAPAGGQRSHLRATPTFFVNGVVQDVSGGMQPYSRSLPGLRRVTGA